MPLKAGAASATTPDPEVNWWVTLVGWMSEYVKCLKCKSSQRGLSLAGRIMGWAARMPVCMWVPVAPAVRTAWQRALRNMDEHEDDYLLRLCGNIQANAQRA